MATLLDNLVKNEEPKAHDIIDALIQKAQDIRPVARENVLPGSKSTHLMAQSDNYAFPTLFPKDPTSKTTTGAYDDWIEYPPWAWKQAMGEAEERGELFEFETEEEAQKFAEGSWKSK